MPLTTLIIWLVLYFIIFCIAIWAIRRAPLPASLPELKGWLYVLAAVLLIGALLDLFGIVLITGPHIRRVGALWAPVSAQGLSPSVS